LDYVCFGRDRSNETEAAVVYFNWGDGRAEGIMRFELEMNVWGVLFEDLNGDGRVDMAALDTGTSEIAVLLNESDAEPDTCGESFMRGDANGTGSINLLDVLAILKHLFKNGPAPGCRKAGDVDDNGRLNLSDAIFLANYLFQQGRPLPPPTESCGIDPTPDNLNCEVYPACP
jgi:hypothetical protein